jgi:hypothetical protein
MIRPMSPGLLVLLLVACLLAMLPVWRLRVAGWPRRWLLAAWILYAFGILAAVRFPGPVRFLLPILVLAYLAPFVAGPERLTRVLHGRRRDTRTVIDVTPAQPPGLPRPGPEPGTTAAAEPGTTTATPRDVTPDADDREGPVEPDATRSPR